jgi:hypothetical protein
MRRIKWLTDDQIARLVDGEGMTMADTVVGLDVDDALRLLADEVQRSRRLIGVVRGAIREFGESDRITLTHAVLARLALLGADANERH